VTGEGATVTPLHVAGTRTLRVTPQGIFELLRAASRDDVRIVIDGIPRDASIARWRLAPDGALELDVFHHAWPEPDADKPIEPRYAVRFAAGGPTDWGPPTDLERSPNR